MSGTPFLQKVGVPPPPSLPLTPQKKKIGVPFLLHDYPLFQLNSVPHFDAQTDISQRDKVLFCLGCLFSSFNRKRWAFVFEVSDENLVSENFEMEKTSINKNNNKKKKTRGPWWPCDAHLSNIALWEPDLELIKANILIKVQNDYNKVFCWFGPVT